MLNFMNLLIYLNQITHTHLYNTCAYKLAHVIVETVIIKIHYH